MLRLNGNGLKGSETRQAAVRRIKEFASPHREQPATETAITFSTALSMKSVETMRKQLQRWTRSLLHYRPLIDLQEMSLHQKNLWEPNRLLLRAPMSYKRVWHHPTTFIPTRARNESKILAIARIRKAIWAEIDTGEYAMPQPCFSARCIDN